MGAAEVAAHLGCSRQRVTQLSHADGFPTPVARLRMGTVWSAAEIRKWAARTRPERKP